MTDPRILLVTGLPTKSLTDSDYYTIFGQFGAVRQVRASASSITRGCAIVVYEQCDAAEAAVRALDHKPLDKGREMRVVVYDKERDRRALDRRKRAREKHAEYTRHVAQSVEDPEAAAAAPAA